MRLADVSNYDEVQHFDAVVSTCSSACVTSHARMSECGLREAGPVTSPAYNCHAPS